MSAVDVAALVERAFPIVGAIHSIVPHEGGRSSNPHFVVDGAGGRFFLKQIKDASALYADDGISRLRTIARATHELSLAGLPVEHVVTASAGDHVVEAAGSAFRLFQFLNARTFDGSESDAGQAARALALFHRCGREALAPDTHALVAAFRFPYPLAQTAQRFAALVIGARKSAEAGGPHAAAYQAVVDDAQLIGRALARALKSSTASGGPGDVLVHLDLHPDNVLFDGAGDAILIDLDNMMIGPRMKCMAFAISRFATAIGEDDVRRSIDRWLHAADIGDLHEGAILDGMVALEVEKILRILARVDDTGAYEHFVDNIPTRHIPALVRLELALGGG